MAKIAINKEGVEVTEEVTRTPREVRWDAFLANYEKKNPTKYASKKANGEFETIPVSFQ